MSENNFIRVANIIEEAKVGGPQIRMARLAERLSKEVETTVVMPRSNSKGFEELLRKSEIRYRTISLSRITREPAAAVQYVLCSVFEILALYIFFKKEAFDIVHASGGAWQYKGIIAGKLAGCRVIWHLNDTALPRFFRWLFQQLSGIPDYYIFSSNRTKSYYDSLIKNESIPTGLVRQPVNTKEFCSENETTVNTIASDAAHSTITIGTVANINPIKGLELFILVASYLNKQFDNLDFIIVGPVHRAQEKYFRHLLEYADDLQVNNLCFSGKSVDIRRSLSLFDVFLCTSLNESGPLTLWEAMSMKKAVVTTDVGDVKEHLCSGVSGDIVRVDDAVEMTEKVARLIADREKRIRYGEEARKVILQKFDVDICAASQLSIYRDITFPQNRRDNGQ